MTAPRAVLALVAITTMAMLGPARVSAGTADDALWSTVAGTDGRIYMADSDGRAVIWRGFNIKTTDPTAAVTAELLAAARFRGFNLMRLSWFWQLLEPTQGTIDQDYLQDISAALDLAESYGIRVILDNHQDLFGETFNSHGVPAWATRTDGYTFESSGLWITDYLSPAVQAAFEHLYEDPDLQQAQIESWMTVVNAFHNHPAVIGWDLMNEPFGKIRDGESFGDAAARVEATQITPMYQRITDAIRTVDPVGWVFVESPNVASLGLVTNLGTIDDDRVVYFPHFYDPGIETATYTPGGQIEYNPAFFETWEAVATHYLENNDVPMLVGEWGVARPELPGMDQFISESLEAMERLTSGWTMFTWCGGSGYCPLDNDLNDRPGINQIVQPYARAIAGAPTYHDWTAASRTLEITYRASGVSAPHVIFIPEAALYPQGWKVMTDLGPEGLAAGTWNSWFNAETGLLEVSMPDDGLDHLICVMPSDSDLPREIETPPTTTTSTVSTPPSTSPTTTAAPATTTTKAPRSTKPSATTVKAAAAQAVRANPAYTG